MKTLLILAACFAFLGPSLLQTSSAQAAEPLTKTQIEEIVRETLLNNPEIVIEAIEAYRAQQEAAELAQRDAAFKALKGQLFNDPETPDNAAESYDVTIVEFFDYQCHYCKKIHPDLASVLASDSKIRVLYKEFPILGPASVTAARAAFAAEQQGRYLDFHNALMDLRGALSEDRIFRLAGDLGLDTTKLRVDMQSPEIERKIQKNHRLANELGVTGTPAMFVGETFVPGYVDEARLRQLISDARSAS